MLGSVDKWTPGPRYASLGRTDDDRIIDHNTIPVIGDGWECLHVTWTYLTEIIMPSEFDFNKHTGPGTHDFALARLEVRPDPVLVYMFPRDLLSSLPTSVLSVCRYRSLPIPIPSWGLKVQNIANRGGTHGVALYFAEVFILDKQGQD